MQWMKEWAAVAQAGGEGESPSRDVAQGLRLQRLIPRVTQRHNVCLLEMCGPTSHSGSLKLL